MHKNTTLNPTLPAQLIPSQTPPLLPQRLPRLETLLRHTHTLHAPLRVLARALGVQHIEDLGRVGRLLRFERVEVVFPRHGAFLEDHDGAGGVVGEAGVVGAVHDGAGGQPGGVVVVEFAEEGGAH